MDFVLEVSEIVRKYRKTEPRPLVVARITTLTICVLLLIAYFIILSLLVILDRPVISTEIQEVEVLPIPDFMVSFNYHFNLSCKFRYLDGTQSETDICTNRCISQPKCANSTEDGRWYGYFTVNPDEKDVNFNKTAKRYGIWITINIDDPRYTRGDDKGMFLTAYDSDFNPRTVDINKENMALNYDPDFYRQLNQSNFHIIGFHQVNWMFIDRHIKKKLTQSGLSILGAPPSYFDMPYITSKYESVTNPATTPDFDIQPAAGQQLYSNLFIGTLNWYQQIHRELRTRHVLDSMSLLAGFYAFLVGCYVLLFGFSPIIPWGLVQIWFMRRQIKEKLRKNYIHGIPLIDNISRNVPIKERVEDLEKFLKQFICEIDYMEDVREKEADDEEKDNTVVKGYVNAKLDNVENEIYGDTVKGENDGGRGEKINEKIKK